MQASIIDNYRDLPLGKWEDIIAANDIPDEVDRQVAVIAILTGLTTRQVLHLPVTEYADYASKAAFLTKPLPKIGRPASSYRAGGFTLIPSTDLRKITTAQYIDFQTFAPEGDKRLVEILSVFLVPQGKDYNEGYDIGEVQTAIREDLSVQDAVYLSAFFLSRYAALIRGTRISLERMLKKERKPERKEAIRERLATLSRGDGAGWPRWTP